MSSASARNKKRKNKNKNKNKKKTHGGGGGGSGGGVGDGGRGSKGEHARRAGEDLAVYGVRLLLTNQFNAATQLYEQHADEDERLCALHVTMYFVSAASSYASGDLNNALELTWASEKKGAALAGSKDMTERILGKLLQAETHKIGAMVQLIQQSYVKAAWNLRKAWKFYETSLSLIKEYEGPRMEDLQGWAGWGVGFFNLMVSLLPPSVLRIAEWAGFSADREEGLRLIRSVHEGTSWVAPLASLQLLLWTVVTSVFLGVQTPEHLAESEGVLAQCDRQFPGGIFFDFMRSRRLRCVRNMQEAIAVAEQALPGCKELPAFSQLFYYQAGFCALFLLDFKQTAVLFRPLLYSKIESEESKEVSVEGSDDEEDGNELAVWNNLDSPPGPPPGYQDVDTAQASVQAFYAYVIAIAFVNDGNLKQASHYFARVPALLRSKKRPIEEHAEARSAQWRKRLEEGSRPATKSRGWFGWGGGGGGGGGGGSNDDNSEESKVPLAETDVVRNHAVLDLFEMVHAWNGFVQMDDATLGKAEQILDQCLARMDGWDPEEMARIHLYRASLLMGKPGKEEEALRRLDSQVLSTESQWSSSKKGKSDGTMAFAHALRGVILVDLDRLEEAKAELEIAGKHTKTFHLGKMTNFRLHSLKANVRRKQELAS